MKRLFLALLFALLVAEAKATCTSNPLPAGSFTIIDCNAESVVAQSASFAVADGPALVLGTSLAWSNFGSVLANGAPVSGQVTFTNGSALVSWPNHHMSAGQYVVLTTTYPNTPAVGSLPSNYPASTLTTQTVLYVIAAGLTTNALELSLTSGGTPIIANANGSAWAFNLLAGFYAASDSVFNVWVGAQQAAATPAPVVPAPLTITPAQ